MADMGYIEAQTKRRLRETRHIAVVTRLKEGMRLVPPFESCERAVCEQGQTLQWLGYEAADQLHWFGVTDPDPLCSWCWQAAQCARQFSHSPAEHETLLGLIPMNTRTNQRLLQQVRPWIEPAQSYEKNQLGLTPDLSKAGFSAEKDAPVQFPETSHDWGAGKCGISECLWVL